MDKLISQSVAYTLEECDPRADRPAWDCCGFLGAWHGTCMLPEPQLGLVMRHAARAAAPDHGTDAWHFASENGTDATLLLQSMAWTPPQHYRSGAWH